MLIQTPYPTHQPTAPQTTTTTYYQQQTILCNAQEQTQCNVPQEQAQYTAPLHFTANPINLLYRPKISAGELGFISELRYLAKTHTR